MTTPIHYEFDGGGASLRTPAPESRFRWAQRGQYSWVYRHDGVGEAPFLAEVEPCPYEYLPSPKLHLVFARLANHPPAKTLTEIQRFAHKYGPLGVAQMIPADQRVGKFAPFLPRHAGQVLAEPLGRWWRQAREMRNLLGLAGRLGSAGSLEGFLRWGQMSYHPEGTTIEGDQNRAFLTVQHSAFKPASQAFNLQITDCDMVPGEFDRRDSVRAAVVFLAWHLDQALTQWVEVRSSFSEGKLRVQRWPKNLLGYLWLGLADDLATRVPSVRICDGCGLSYAGRGRRCLDCA